MTNHPSELILQDVRCFQGEQRGRLRPLTLLVGENGTGKTTFLGGYRVLHRLLSERWLAEGPDFNEEPFPMGSFRDIVRSRGPGGRIDEFKLGFTVAGPGAMSKRAYRLSARFSDMGSQPIVSSYRWDFDEDSYLELRRSEASEDGGVTLAIPNHEVSVDAPFESFGFHFLTTDRRRTLEPLIRSSAPVGDFLNRWFPLTTSKGASWPFRDTLPPVAVAPLRSKPRRTYDPTGETATPEGEHIPTLMMRLDFTDKEQWRSLHDELVAFGRDSGLFSDIKIKRHGRQMSDPFQLQVKVRSGSHVNIMDVGYGISQSLPTLVNLLAEPKGRRSHAGRLFLLQQPEVYLHPRGQAELASLFVDSFKKHGNRFLIETHSDFIIDRMRIAVREGRLNADDVSILYFEPTGNAVKIHSMTLDGDGNLEDVPPSYREFFLKETDRFLGFRS